MQQRSPNPIHKEKCHILISDLKTELDIELSTNDLENLTKIGLRAKELALDNSSPKLLKIVENFLNLADELKNKNVSSDIIPYRRLRVPLSAIKKHVNLINEAEKSRNIHGNLPATNQLEGAMQALAELSYAFGIRFKIDDKKDIRVASSKLLKALLKEEGAYEQMPESINAFLSIKNGFKELFDATRAKDSNDENLIKIIDNLNQDCHRAGLFDTELSILCGKTMQHIDSFVEMLTQQESNILDQDKTLQYKLEGLLTGLSAGDSPVRQAFRPAHRALRDLSKLAEEEPWKAKGSALQEKLLKELSEVRKVARYYGTKI